MSSEIVLQPSADAAALPVKRAQLAALRGALAEREAELAQLRVQLRAFESRYFRQVGGLYAELDEIEARIAEREVELYGSDSARERAEEARKRAQETHDAAFAEEREEEDEVEPPASLKTLFRDVARRIHPDFARDEDERVEFTRLMARANQAYRRGDGETLLRLLDDHREIHSALAGESAAAELARIARQVQHAERDLAALEAERHSLMESEIAQLHEDAEAATAEHRDLLTELAAQVRERIADAQYRLEFVERQVWVQRGSATGSAADSAGRDDAHGG